jgi:putative ABC transport system substrate-binding protein
MGRQSRRQFLQGMAGAAVSAAGLTVLAGCGVMSTPAQQPARMPRIGFLSTGNRESRAPHIEAFRQGLRESGYVEGQNIAIDFRFTEGKDDRLPELAAELVALPVDVILASGGTPPNLATKQATTTIPVVMGTSGDPVATGLVASLARPEGNVTGLTVGSLEISGKRLELLRETLPGLSRVAAFSNPNNPFHVLQEREVEAAARALGIRVQALHVRSADDLPGAFEAAIRENADAVYGGSDALITNTRTQIAELAARHRLPAIYDYKEIVDAGGLMAYGPSIPHLYGRAAGYVDKILRGARPADLPVEQPTRFDFIINLKTAQALGLTIPPSVLAQTTEVIQ